MRGAEEEVPKPLHFEADNVSISQDVELGFTYIKEDTLNIMHVCTLTVRSCYHTHRKFIFN